MTSARHGSPAFCTICRSSDTLPLLEIAAVPVHCNVAWPTRQEAIEAPRADISLVWCPHCGHAFNSVFDPDKVAYDVGYENSLHFSPTFQTYATELATRFAQKYKLHNKCILEIGAGRGEFLDMLCTSGDNYGIGLDPSVPEMQGGSGRWRLVRATYSEQYYSFPADAIVCRQVLEHIADPVQFLLGVRRGFGDRTSAVLLVEVPNGTFTLSKVSSWDLIYEHCSYFSALSLQLALSLAGFRVCEIREAFGGQFLIAEALPGRESSFSRESDPTPGLGVRGPFDPRRLASIFAEEHRMKVRSWRERLLEYSRKKQRVVVWGAGSKGVTFLNLVASPPLVDLAIDINPRKEGKYVAGTGQRIALPDALRGQAPDVIVVMNENYVGEIRQQLRAIDAASAILVA